MSMKNIYAKTIFLHMFYANKLQNLICAVILTNLVNTNIFNLILLHTAGRNQVPNINFFRIC